MHLMINGIKKCNLFLLHPLNYILTKQNTNIMTNLDFTNTLQFGRDKYMITKRLYQELISQTNYIGDYNEARAYVYKAMNNCFKEIQQVTEFKTKKIDIEL